MDHLVETALELPVPREEAFAFFAEAANLERITPPELRFHIVAPGSIDLALGTLIEYRLRLFGVPFAWLTRISAWEAPRRFVDLQVRGPYALWVHEHRFTETDGGTLIEDRVVYRLPASPAGELAYPLVRRQLARIFAYRQATVRSLLAPADWEARDERDGRGERTGRGERATPPDPQGGSSMDTHLIDDWLERYRHAWTTDDRGEIEALFTADVRYSTAPYRPPLSGLDELAAYWLGEGESGIAWVFEHEALAQEGDLFVVRAVTTYPGGTRDADGPEVFHNLWLVTLGADGRCREFVEYFMLVE